MLSSSFVSTADSDLGRADGFASTRAAERHDRASLSRLQRATDTDLAKALLENEPAAQRVVWQRFFPVVSGMARRRLGRSNETEDVVQDVFTSVFRSARALRDPVALRAFVLTITSRTVAREIKRRRARFNLTLTTQEQLEGLVKVAADPASKHALLVLKRFVERLRPRERRAFVLTFVEGMDAAEVAEVLGVSVPTVRRALARASQRISLWAGRDPFLGDYLRCRTT